MCRPAYSGIRDGNGDTDRHHTLSCCLCAHSVSNKNLVYVLRAMQRTQLVIANTVLRTAFYRLARLLCLNNCTKEESITIDFIAVKDVSCLLQVAMTWVDVEVLPLLQVGWIESLKDFLLYLVLISLWFCDLLGPLSYLGVMITSILVRIYK